MQTNSYAPLTRFVRPRNQSGMKLLIGNTIIFMHFWNERKRKDFLWSLFLATVISWKRLDLEQGDMAEWTTSQSQNKRVLFTLAGWVEKVRKVKPDNYVGRTDLKFPLVHISKGIFFNHRALGASINKSSTWSAKFKSETSPSCIASSTTPPITVYIRF